MKQLANRFSSRRWTVLCGWLLILGLLAIVVSIASSRESLPPFDEIYTAEQRFYFKEIALKCDPQVLRKFPHVRCVEDRISKWREPIRVAVVGDPSDTDLREVNKVIRQLRSLIRPVEIRKVDSAPNVVVHVIPGQQFDSVYPGLLPATGAGIEHIDSTTGYIHSATVLIDATEPELRRRHLVREELTQILGLGNDTWDYWDSIFYQGQTDVTEFASIDRAVIRLLYDPRIRPGMNGADLERLGI